MQILLLTAIVGVVGMGLGATISAIFGNISNRVMCWLLSFAGGVMISVVAFKLIPKGIEMAGVTVTVIGLVLGVAGVAVLNYFLNLSAEINKAEAELAMEDHLNPDESQPPHEEAAHSCRHEEDSGQLNCPSCGTHICDRSNTQVHHKEIPPSILPHSEGICCHSDHAKQLICSPALTRSGLILLIALSLHKLPEGIAIGAAGTHNMALSILLAFSAILHCLPEGMAIGAPLICGGMSKKKAIFLVALGGTPTIIGGAIGMFVGGISDMVLAFVLSIAAGTMLFVVFGEIIPQSLSLIKSKLTSYAAMAGFLVGLIAIFVFASPICPHGHLHGHVCEYPHHYPPETSIMACDEEEHSPDAIDEEEHSPDAIDEEMIDET